MFRHLICLLTFLHVALAAAVALSPNELAKLPPPTAKPIDFAKDIQPLLETSCTKCHAKGKDKGGFSIETRASFLKGGETGPAAEPGKSGESLVVEMVAALDPDNVMPKKGARWTPEQVGLLRAWIDQGLPWPEGVSFAKPAPRNLEPPMATLPAEGDPHPIDRIIAAYSVSRQLSLPELVDDRLFVRRVYLDVVGLLPTPKQLDAFLSDTSPDKRSKLVRELLGDERGYAEHWLSFWNDLLRNDYKGTGFIDGGRKQISEWLFNALLTNKPYDQFVSELVNPTAQSQGFTAGIIWRGNVPAAMSPPMQAAQSVSQVLLGINLKCASCHDSFINDWSLADAYGMAAVFSEDPLELVHCDKPTGKKATVRFLYPELGQLDSGAPRTERMKQLAALMTGEANGRLARTVVNRLWARLLGRGLVEPLDDMEQPAWSPELLDWLAADLIAHKYDLKQTLERILTSRAYQFPSVETPSDQEAFVFRGPLLRRLSAEQYADALSALTGEWAALPASPEFDFTGGGTIREDLSLPTWLWTDEPLAVAAQRNAWRAAKGQADAAQARAAEAQKLVEQQSPKAGEAMKAAQAAADAAARAMKEAAVAREPGRHRIVFRKRFTLEQKPKLAYAVVAATQGFELRINGGGARQRLVDNTRNGRIRIFDATELLQAGENVVAISVDSHTEKGMNDIERKEFPGSAQHLNKTSGVAFYLRSRADEKFVEITTDSTWKVRRSPEGAWFARELADAEWAGATPLPAGAVPVDEGPGLAPIKRKDFANIAVELGSGLRAPVSVAAFADRIRASMLAADPLQAALERPNREVVMPVRQTAATTIQALELTNGATLNSLLQRASPKLAASITDPAAWVRELYHHAVSREPSPAEQQLASALVGPKPAAEGVADFLWALTMTPEFQFIH